MQPIVIIDWLTTGEKEEKTVVIALQLSGLAEAVIGLVQMLPPNEQMDYCIKCNLPIAWIHSYISKYKKANGFRKLVTAMDYSLSIVSPVYSMDVLGQGFNHFYHL